MPARDGGTTSGAVAEVGKSLCWTRVMERPFRGPFLCVVLAMSVGTLQSARCCCVGWGMAHGATKEKRRGRQPATRLL
jgi:hypothetical protein